MTNNRTFIKITNIQIYEKLNSIDSKLDKMSGTVGWHSKAIAAIIIILGIMIGALI